MKATLINTRSLPDDLQQLILDWLEHYAGIERLPDTLPVETVLVARFPDEPLDPGRAITDPAACSIPVVISDQVWMDGRHRLALCKMHHRVTVQAINLAPLGVQPDMNGADCIARLLSDP